MDKNTTIHLSLTEGDLTLESTGNSWEQMAHELAAYAVRRARQLRKSAYDYESIACKIAGYDVVRSCQLDAEHIAGEHADPNPYQLSYCATCAAGAEAATTGEAGINA